MNKKILALGLSLLTCLNLTACDGLSWSSSLGDGVGAQNSSATSSYGAAVTGYSDFDTTSSLQLETSSKNYAYDDIVQEVQAISGSGIKASYDASSKSSTSNNNSSSSQNKPSKKSSSQKLIRSVSLDVEIKSSNDLQKSVDSIIALTESYNGWVAYNNVDYASRYAGGSLELRIPKDSVDTFIETVESTDMKLKSKSDNTEDVTMKYVDTQSRLNVKITQRDKYMQYLEQATNTTELLEIEDRLASVIADIESYEQQIRQMDSLIEYTEVSVNISCETSANRESFWERFKSAISDIRESIADTFLGGMEWFLNALITLIFVIPIIIIVIRAIVLAFTGEWRWKKKDKTKKNDLKKKTSLLLNRGTNTKTEKEKEIKPAEDEKKD